MVNVYDDTYDWIIARVQYNDNLDQSDGHNWACGQRGHHKGITKLKNGKFVLIYGSNWEGERDYALIISPAQALQEILKAAPVLLKKYPELEEEQKKLLEEEDEED